MTLLAEQLTNACRSLCANQNADGGIDVTKHGDTSGCWTTASALWAILRSNTVSYSGISVVRDMTRFLLESQIAIGRGAAWPMMPGGSAISTMATGHAIAALVEVFPLFEGEKELAVQIGAAVERSLEWLEHTQNDDGGWVPQPLDVGSSAASSIFASYYSLLCFWSPSPLTRGCDAIRARGVQYLISVMNTDGTWGSDGHTGEISDTSRAITTLIQCRRLLPDHPIIKNGARFLLKRQGHKGLWPLGRIELVLPKSSGITVFNNNRTLDSLVALSLLQLRSRRYRETIKDGLTWLMSTQEASTGTWYLSSKYDPPKRELHTWPTTEWLFTAAALTATFARMAFEDANFTSATPLRRMTMGFVAIVFACAGFVGGLNWDKMPSRVQDFLLITVVAGVALNVVSGFLHSSISRWWGQISKSVGEIGLR